MTERIAGVNPQAEPSGEGCAECLKHGSWWLHLRRCAECGHIGCCDSSPNKHATKHAHHAGHPIITSYEPGENWFYDYRIDKMIPPPAIELRPPRWHPADQPVPGPEGRVPRNWETLMS